MNLRKILVFTAIAAVPAGLPVSGNAAPEKQDSLAVHERTGIIEESVISSSRDTRQIEGVMSGNLRLNAENFSGLPKFLGTNDILKTLQLIPGVQTSGELDSGIYIRGSDPGQTLVMLDGATIYAPSHLMGFFSVFNSDHLSSASVYKSGGLPAKYGGCAANVIDIETTDDIRDSTGGTINVGMISSQATLAVPLWDNSMITVSGRGSYVNYALKGINKLTRNREDMPEYGMQDYNLTWLARIGKSNTIKLNGYYGQDRMYFLRRDYSILASLKWYNAAASAVWENRTDSGMTNRHILSFSRFSNGISIERPPACMRLPSDITDFSYKGNTSVPFRQSRLSFGANYTFHISNVQYPLLTGVNDMIDNIGKPAPYYTHEFGLFADYSLWFNFPLTIDVGIRYGGAVTGRKLHSGPEPRIALSYKPSRNMNIRANFSIQRQYMNMVSISGMGMPTDFWIPVTENISPQISRTVSIGFSHSLLDNTVEYGIEPYFSLADNVLEYDGGLFEMTNSTYEPEENIISGYGRNYGVEMIVRKNSGKVTGWISYTLSRSERSFPEIMGGTVFPAKHDRTHNLSATASYELSDRWTFSAIFVYATGSAYTPPSGIYILGENIIQEYGKHNSARMPDYHRLDISATYNFKSKGRCRHSLNASVYNVYARENPLYRDLRFSEDTENNTIKMTIRDVSLYSLLPSVSYTFKF